MLSFHDLCWRFDPYLCSITVDSKAVASQSDPRLMYDDSVEYDVIPSCSELTFVCSTHQTWNVDVMLSLAVRWIKGFPGNQRPAGPLVDTCWPMSTSLNGWQGFSYYKIWHYLVIYLYWFAQREMRKKSFQLHSCVLLIYTNNPVKHQQKQS